MKKGTLAILLLAAALGGYVYYTEFRHPKPKPETDTSKALLNFAAADIAGLTFARADSEIVAERKDLEWKISKPVETRADRTALDELSATLAGARFSRWLPVEGTRANEYGLDAPAVSIEIRLKKGERHVLRLGAKDFSSDSVYARLDSNAGVVLLPATLLTAASKPLADLRDRSVLILPSGDLKEIEIRSAKATLRLEKKDATWSLASPRTLLADDSEVGTLSAAISGGKFADVASETAKDLPLYGLSSPAITVRVKSEKGEEGTLLVGKKKDGKFYARDASRPFIFLIEQSLVDSLSVSVETLRDKHVVRFQKDDVVRVRFHDKSGEVIGLRKPDGKWVIDQPADRKGKEMAAWKIFDPLSNLRAKEVLDAPSNALLAKLVKPAIEVEMSDKAGKMTKVLLSEADGEFVYARTNLAPTLFKVQRFILQELNLPAADLAPQ